MKKIQDFLAFKKIGFLLLLFVWLIFLFFMQPWDKLKGNILDFQYEKSDSYKIYGSKVVTQTFSIDEVFDSIDLSLVNYNNTYNGRCTVKIYDGSGDCIYKKDIDKVELDQEWYEIHLPYKIFAQDGKETYTLELTAKELNKNNCVLVYASDQGSYPDEISMDFNGKKQSKILCFSVYAVRKNVFAVLAIIMFAVCAVIWWFYGEKSIVIHSLLILGGMGFCMFIMMAPFSAPDEIYHYHSSFVLSNIMLGQEDVFAIPEDYNDFSGLREHRNANSAYVRVREDFFCGRESTKEDAIQRANQLNHPIVYLASALGITISRLLGFGFIPLFYLGRFFNLLLYITLAWMAVMITPKYKELVLLTAVLPMCLNQAVSYSYDVLINGMAFVFVAVVLKLSCRGFRMKWKNVLCLIAIGGVLCPGKVVYITLLFLVFMIPKENFKSVKDHRLKLAVVLAGVLLFLVATQYQELWNRMGMGNTTVGTTTAISGYSVWFIFKYPMKSLQLWYRTIVLSMMGWIRQGIGGSLAGYTVPIHEYLICGFVILLLVICLRKDQDTFLLKVYQKVICRITVLGGIFLIMLAFFTDNIYGSSNILLGIQGRYFIPFILPFLFGLQTEKMMVKIETKKLFMIYWFLQAGVMNCILSSVIY